ncbi:MAG: glycosyltransferase family 2 protein [Gammaproteobacteria bacterium]|nr:glycosyltransferase family 2 protein [Gammaproteobacteria bacterium]
MVAPRARAAVAAEPLPEQPQLSIIIPVLNEADCLDQNLTRLFALPWVTSNCEVIVCDGGSRDDSVAIAAGYRCRIVQSDASRAQQMNRGARAALGRQLLFLHADSALPADLDEKFPLTASWGFFRLRLNDDAAVFRMIESAINLRSRFTRVAGGDQGLFFERSFFESLGAFPGIPLMEDIAICKLARRLAQPVVIDSPMCSSSRRWHNNGVFKTIALMWSLRLAYWLGVNPAKLHRIYYPQGG